MSRRRFQPADWLDLGLSELARAGAEAIKLEAICAAAGLTRGSFYHHFEDHAAFLVQMAQRWFDQQTLQVAAQMPQDGSPDARADALTEAAMQVDYRLELGIRELARRVPQVAVILRTADDARLDVLRTLYQDRFDLDTATASSVAYLEYAAFSGLILLDPDMDQDRQYALQAQFDRMVTALFETQNAPSGLRSAG